MELRRRMPLVTSLIALAIVTHVHAAEPQKSGVKSVSDVSYISGGVGSDERERMEQAAAGFNLRVEIAAPGGNFLGGGQLRIDDAAGKAVLDVKTDGPVTYVKLPPGRYTVEVKDPSSGASKSTAADVPASGRKDVVVSFPG